MSNPNIEKELDEIPKRASKPKASKKQKKKKRNPFLIGGLCLIPLVLVVLLILPDDKEPEDNTPKTNEVVVQKDNSQKADSEVNEPINEVKGQKLKNGSLHVIGKPHPITLTEEDSRKLSFQRSWTLFVGFKGQSGTIVSKTPPSKFTYNSKILYIDKEGVLRYGLGKNNVSTGVKVNDGNYHKVVVNSSSGIIEIYVDGKLCATKALSHKDDSNFRFKIGRSGSSFGGIFKGHVRRVAFWDDNKKGDALRSLSYGQVNKYSTDFYYEYKKITGDKADNKIQSSSNETPVQAFKSRTVDEIYQALMRDNPNANFRKDRIQTVGDGFTINLNDVRIKDISSSS